MLKLRTYLRLGLINVLRVGIYRIGLRSGLHPVLRVKRSLQGTRFFRQVPKPDKSLKPQSAWQDTALFFGWYEKPLENSPPEWHANPFTGARIPHLDRPWWKLADFDPAVGDIKAIWEASRFDWVLAFAQRARTGDHDSLKRLNSWLAGWCRDNPPYLGPNWKCGQEASIRVMHLAIAALILGQDKSAEKDLINLVEAHLARISPTLSYALAQDNNHGTSEAAALFMGGNWCALHGINQGKRWERMGRKCLENRARRLIEPDGSFSQYSVNYHRLMLDTLCMAEIWRRAQGLEEFSPLFYERAKAAALWLYALVEPESGDAPNLGSNDGARLLSLTDADFRDFRPSVELAMTLFAGGRAYGQDGWHALHLSWLDVKGNGYVAQPPGSTQFDHGGYCVLRRGPWMALFKYPRYRFRPSHCDALHLDLWHGSTIVLRDAGSYSYNAKRSWQEYFPSTAAHNTIEFDARDQMPRISRFLKGAWLQTDKIEHVSTAGDEHIAAGYQDYLGSRHYRKTTLSSDGCVVVDTISRMQHKAVLRWRLVPDSWQIKDTSVLGSRFKLTVQANIPVKRFELCQAWESPYYLHCRTLPVLEVEVDKACTITTKIRRVT